MQLIDELSEALMLFDLYEKRLEHLIFIVFSLEHVSYIRFSHLFKSCLEMSVFKRFDRIHYICVLCEILLLLCYSLCTYGVLSVFAICTLLSPCNEKYMEDYPKLS